MTGLWLGLFCVQPKSAWVYLGRALAFGLLSMNLYWVVLSGAGFLYAYYEFPLLADFESPLALQTMRANGLKDRVLRDKAGNIIAGEHLLTPIKTIITRSSEYASRGTYSLKIQMGNQRYAGVAFNSLVRDWSAYRTLEFDLYNPSQLPLMMMVRISDKQHDLGSNSLADRFNRYLNMQPGWNHISINLDEVARSPEHRSMDMTEITSLVICANRLHEPQAVYLDNLHLGK
jgi:hypothetical protein